MPIRQRAHLISNEFSNRYHLQSRVKQVNRYCNTRKDRLVNLGLSFATNFLVRVGRQVTEGLDVVRRYLQNPRCMPETYEDYLSIIEREAVKDGYGEFRLAREEFHNNTGVFEDGEPWFETRMKMFMDWYLLERIGHSGMTPLEMYLSMYGDTLGPEAVAQMALLAATLRSTFRIVTIQGNTLLLDDLAGGGQWRVVGSTSVIGLERDDLIGVRVVLFGGQLMMSPSTTVLHPREAREDIRNIIARARTERMPNRELVDHLDKMRLKLDRYSNVRIQHIYRYPGDTRL